MISFNRIIYRNDELNINEKYIINGFPHKNVVSGDYSHLLNLRICHHHVNVPFYLINEEGVITFHLERNRTKEFGIRHLGGGWEGSSSDSFSADMKIWLK
jgi:hypothetical protein